MAFAPVVMPRAVFVPAGDTVAAGETIKLPWTVPMPASVCPVASVSVASLLPVTSSRGALGSLPPKKSNELCAIDPLPLNVSLRPLPITVGPL